MKVNKEEITKALYKNYLQIKPQKEDFDTFKKNLETYIQNSKENESEEFLKNVLIKFLDSIYHEDFYINTKDRADLVIHIDKTPKSNVGVMFELKHPTLKSQMITDDSINCKGFQQLILYFLRERINKKNIDFKHLILSNNFDWYIFDASEFERIFYQNNDFVKQFNEWQTGQKTSENTELFYNEIAKPFVDNSSENLHYTYFNINDFANKDDNKLIELYKILSPFHLLKQTYKNDSNTLNTQFYYELLHILGLEEQIENGTRYLRRCKLAESGSLLENTIERIRFYNNLDKIENLQSYGDTKDEQIFGLAIELCIVWLNRILFLKLLEAQLLLHNNGDKNYKFITSEKIKSYSKLDNLFFEVLAVKYEDRSENIKKNYNFIPYLNSSLFEPTTLEKTLFLIGQLDTEAELQLYKATVLKDAKGNKISGKILALQYLLDFLDAYNFGSETEGNLQINENYLINPSVLGLIFEKINGYKDGSFYTPGYITMYMCRQTIRKAVVEEFNKKYKWNCPYESDLKSLYNFVSKIPINEANDLINTITICDPAVGSGHFLVSALNEMIAIKSDLDILTDRNGKLLKNYHLTVENDELKITDIDGYLFEYTLGNEKRPSPEKQRVQEAIFHEKKHLIENCLFGIDINHNSVNITRLRLWIELLKNAYYIPASDYKELQTLPNIDINIKCGNSLLYRFPLDTDLSKILKSIKYDVNFFKSCVQNYKNAENKELKKGYEKSIEQIKGEFKIQIRRLDPRQTKLNGLKDELQDRFLSPKLLQQEYTEQQKKNIDADREKLVNQILQIENEISEEQSGIIFQNALEWRFEFPEVLDSNTGDFLGFNVVVGNPPYIDHKKIAKYSNFIAKHYKTYSSTGDISIYFFELGFEILKNKGFLNYINTNKFFRTEYGNKCRDLLTQNQIHFIVNFEQVPIFKEALVSSTIICNQKNSNVFDFPFAEFNKEPAPEKNFEIEINKRQKYFNGKQLNSKSWSFASDDVQKIKSNIENKGRPIKEIDTIEIFRGVTTGFDDAFIINQETYNELILNNEKNKTIIKPLLKGKDIKKFITKFDNLYLINSHNGVKNKYSRIDIPKDYPKILSHLKKINENSNFGVEKRSDQGEHWTNLRHCAFLELFNNEKIVWPLTADKWGFALDTEKYYLTSGGFFLVSQKISLKYILAVLNSNLMRFYFSQIGVMTAGGAYTLKKSTIERFPLIEPTDKEQKPILKIVDKIIECKQKNTDTIILESELDNLVYRLYDLTSEEISVIENQKI